MGEWLLLLLLLVVVVVGRRAAPHPHPHPHPHWRDDERGAAQEERNKHVEAALDVVAQRVLQQLRLAEPACAHVWGAREECVLGGVRTRVGS
eukprot:46812-Chlamydomonas_euryale.AAC.1